MFSSNNSDKLSANSIPSSMSSYTQRSHSQRVNPQPRYLKDPTAFETISSTFNGLSNFMMKNMIGKTFQKNSTSNTPNMSLSTSPKSINEKILSKARLKAQALCAEFDYIYINQQERRSCLLIGYSDGLHIWDIEDIENIKELALIKLDVGEIRSLKLINSEDNDPLKLNILVGAIRTLPVSPGEENDLNESPKELSVLCLYSLNDHKILFKSVYQNERITNVKANKYCIAMATSLPSIRLLSRKDLIEFHCFTDILITPSSRAPVFTLGARWIAYSTTLETPWKPGFKEISNLPGKSGKVDRVAKDVVSGLKYIGDFGKQKLNDYLKNAAEQQEESKPSPRRNSNGGGFQLKFEISASFSLSPEDKGYLRDSGRVVVRDILEFIDTDLDHPLSPSLGSNFSSSLPSVAHFHCHYYPVACLAFNSTGNLLATASVEGHSFYIYEIIGQHSSQPPFKLLYKLSRGITDAKVVDMVFNIDSRWLATTTSHGTTHLFQINPYGGPAHHESHIQGKVINPVNNLTNSKKQTVDYSKLSTLSPATRFRRIKEELEDNEDNPNDAINHLTKSNENIVNNTMFPILNSSLCNWLNKLPSAYELPNSKEEETKSNQIMLNIDKEGTLMLARIVVSSNPDLNSLPEEREDELSAKVERIAEWSLSKSIGDVDKFYEPYIHSLDDDIGSPFHNKIESSWLPYVETKSYNPYTSFNRPLWLLNQFNFKVYAQGESDSDEPKLIIFNKQKRENQVLRLEKQNISRPSTDVKISFQPSSSLSEVGDHLVSAMQTDMDRPPVTSSIPIKADPISFEDALEIHMVETLGMQKKKSQKKEKRITEIPPDFASDMMAGSIKSISSEDENEFQEENFDQVGVFEMDYDDVETKEVDINSYDDTDLNFNSPPTISVRSSLNDIDDDVNFHSNENTFNLDEFLNL